MECGKCKTAIRLGKVDFDGKVYHKGCFSCSACKKSLKPTDVICIAEGNFFDEQCYSQCQENICSKCGQLIDGACVEVNSKSLHEECFACSKCGKTLSGKKYFMEDGCFYDAECYNALNGLMCDQCFDIIEGFDVKYITYLGKYIHHKCFFCSECKKQLSTAEKFRDVKTTVKGALICSNCSNKTQTKRGPVFPNARAFKV